MARAVLRPISGSSEYMNWNGEHEIACTSTPILSMSRRRCSTDVRQTKTFSACFLFVARDRSFVNRIAGSSSRRKTSFTISSASG